MQVFMHGFRTLRTVYAEAVPICLTHGEYEIPDPRHWKIGQNLLSLLKPVKFR